MCVVEPVGRQPSTKHIDMILETQRNAIELLRVLGTCLIKECDSWNANVLALIKAKQDEEKAIEKARAKAEKDEAKQIQKAKEREEKKTKEKAEKAKRSKEQEESRNTNGDDGEPDQSEGKAAVRKSRPVRGGSAEISEEDFPVIYHGSKVACGAMSIAQDVAAFVNCMAERPHLACMARLRRGPFKKVLVVTRLH